MKGCFICISFLWVDSKVYPVYKVSEKEYLDVNTQDAEEIYVVNDEVFYHDQIIGYLNKANQLKDFNEDLFEYLKKSYENYQSKRKVGYVTQEGKVFAEAPIQREEKSTQSKEKPVKESVDPAAAVDSFMENWQSNIDCEITKMKRDIKEMGLEYNAVG